MSWPETRDRTAIAIGMLVQGLVREQYETWPYPSYSLFAKVRPHMWQLNAAYLASRCGLPAPPERAPG